MIVHLIDVLRLGGHTLAKQFAYYFNEFLVVSEDACAFRPEFDWGALAACMSDTGKRKAYWAECHRIGEECHQLMAPEWERYRAHNATRNSLPEDQRQADWAHNEFVHLLAVAAVERQDKEARARAFGRIWGDQ